MEPSTPQPKPDSLELQKTLKMHTNALMEFEDWSIELLEEIEELENLNRMQISLIRELEDKLSSKMKSKQLREQRRLHASAKKIRQKRQKVINEASRKVASTIRVFHKTIDWENKTKDLVIQNPFKASSGFCFDVQCPECGQILKTQVKTFNKKLICYPMSYMDHVRSKHVS